MDFGFSGDSSMQKKMSNKNTAKSERFERLIVNASVPKAHPKNVRKPSSVKAGIASAGIFITVGLLFLLVTNQMYAVFPYIAGIFLVLIGSFDIVRGIKTQEYKDAETKLLANGIVYVILGLVIVYLRNDSEYMIGALWGLLGIFKSSEALNISLHKMYLKKPFHKELIRAVIELALGILLLIDAHASLQHHIILLGIELLLVGWRILQDAKLLRQQENNV